MRNWIKRLLALGLALCLLGGAAPFAAQAATAEDVSARFKDPVFRWLVTQKIHDIWAGPITETTAAAITELAVPRQAAAEISSLAGLELLTGLKSLDISFCRVTEPFVLPPALEHLRCSGMGLSALPALPAGLRSLDCSENALEYLDLRGCAGLEAVDCRSNYLTECPDTAAGLLWDQGEGFLFSPQLQQGERFVSAAGILPDHSFTVAGYPLELTGTVKPDNASVTELVWTVVDGCGTGAAVAEGRLTAQAPGVAVMEARVPGGCKTVDGYEDFVLRYELTVLPGDSVFPAEGIAGLPAWAAAGEPLVLSGSVSPSYAADQTIRWEITDDGGTGAALEGDTLRAERAGLLRMTAWVANAPGQAIEQPFSLSIVPPGSAPLDVTAGFADSHFLGALYPLVGKLPPEPIYDADLAAIDTLVFADTLAGQGIESLAGLHYFTGLQTLDLRGSSGIYALPQLPASLKVLYTGNEIALLPPLPEGLEHLVCAGSGMTSLPPLPSSLKHLDCGDNRLTELDVTGLELEYLDCRGNLLPGYEAVTGFCGAFDRGEHYLFVPQNVTDFVAVTGILELPSSAMAGEPLILSGRAFPDNASNTDIAWRLDSPGSTGAQLSGSVLQAASSGTVTLTAVVVNGTAPGVDFTQSCSIVVDSNEPFVPVTGITGVAGSAEAGSLQLSGRVLPEGASNSVITWQLSSGGSTGARLSGDLLLTTSPGRVVVTAVVADGKGPGVAFTQQFTIEITQARMEVTANFSSLNPRHTGQLSASGAVGTLHYAVLNSSIATVAEDGTVLGKRPGTTTVYVETSSGQSASVQVKVAYSFGQWLLVIFLLGFLWIPIS